MVRLLAVLLLVLMSFAGQATARGFSGGPHMSFAPHSGFRLGRHGFFAKPGFVHNQFFSTGFNRFQHGFAAWWGGLGSDGWGWPVGDLSDNGYVSPPLQQDQAPAPEVIVVHTDGEGRMTTAQAAPDYSYVGCHAIPNGYHCDTTTEAH